MLWIQLSPQFTERNIKLVPTTGLGASKAHPHWISSSPSVLFLDQTLSGRPLLTSIKKATGPALAANPFTWLFFFLQNCLVLTYIYMLIHLLALSLD